MKCVLTVVCILLISAGSVLAQGGAICLFSNADGTQCDFVDAGGLVQVYLFHEHSAGVMASQFRLDLGGLPWTLLGEMWEFPTVLGTSTTGVSVAYGGCLASPFRLGTVSFFSSAPTSGGMLSIVPDPAVGSLIAVDCNLTHAPLAGGTAYVNSTQPCVCTATPNPDPLLYVYPLAMDLGETGTVESFTVANAGGGTLEWTASESASWLDVSPTAGTGGGTVTVTADRSALSPGYHSALISVSSNGGNETVTVELTVPLQEPALGVSPLSLNFGLDDVDLTLTVFNAGSGTLNWTIVCDQTWLTANPLSGTGGADVTVSVDRTGLTPGIHTGNVQVFSNGGDISVPVSMTVPEPYPILNVAPGSLSFGDTDTERTLVVFNTGSGELNWNISGDEPWLSAVPASGVNDAAVTVTIDRTGLPDGFYQGNLYVTSAGGDATVPVDMWVGGIPVLYVNPVTLVYALPDTVHGFNISNTGGGTLEWSLGDDRDWINIVPPLSGTGNTTVWVSVDPALVPDGPVQTGYVTVSSNGGTASVEIRFVRQTGTSPGTIAIYADAGHSTCNFVDNGGVIQVHFFHMNTDGATASQWKLDLNGVGWTHLGTIWNWPTVIGNPLDGVSIGYGGCWASPIYMGVANFAGSTALACSVIRIVADPSALSGQIEGVDCSETKTYPGGAIGRVNPTYDCSCDAIPVRHTTWGAIKAMYQ